MQDREGFDERTGSVWLSFASVSPTARTTVGPMREGDVGPRRVAVPLWSLIAGVAVAAFLAGVLAAGTLTADGNRAATPLAATQPGSPQPSPTDAPSPTAQPQASPTLTPGPPRPTATPQPKPARTITTAVRPRGEVRFYAPGGEYGQGIQRKVNCASWKLLLENNSSDEVTAVTWRPVSAGYTDYGQWNAKTQEFATKPAKTPPAQRLRLSVQAHTSQDVTFMSCTSTPWPGGGYSFSETPPGSVAVTWLSGFRGEAATN